MRKEANGEKGETDRQSVWREHERTRQEKAVWGVCVCVCGGGGGLAKKRLEGRVFESIDTFLIVS